MRSAKKIDLRLIRRKILSLGLPFLVLAMAASASNVTTVTPAGSSTSEPVAATATFIAENGFAYVPLNELLLRSLSFTLSNGASGGTLFQRLETPVTLNSSDTYLADPAGSGLNNDVSGSLQLNTPSNIIGHPFHLPLPGQFQVQGCVSTDPSCGLSSVPEPVSLVLTGSGLIGLLFLRRRRR